MNLLPALPTLLALCSLLPAPTNGAGRKPNVILFLVDDMGWMDCGAYGSQYYETPRIDSFARRAMRFTDAYAQPLCSPTRGSLLTGKHSARHGITSATGHRPPQPAGHRFLPAAAAPNQPILAPESRNYLEPSEYTLAECLRDAGYRTAHIGKWHLGLTPPHWPEAQGFETAFHCHPDPGPPGNYFSPYHVTPDGTPRSRESRAGTITDGPAGEYIVDRLADEAVKFIEAHRDRPFFLNLWNYGVHGPWGHKEEYTRAFSGRKDPRGTQGNPIMASMLRSVDECFGRVLDALDRLGLAKDTIVIFNSDNGGNTHSNVPDNPKTDRAASRPNPQLADWRRWAGDRPPTSNAPLRDGKGTLYEGGTRVPLLWSWPGHIPPGTTNASVVGHVDLYPTVLDLLDLPHPPQQRLDGMSYAKALRSGDVQERTAFFNYFPHGASPGRAGGVWARSGDWKLIRWFGLPVNDPARHELYNLRADLGETRNLAGAESERVRQLDSLIDSFLTDTGATFPRPNPAFKPAAAAVPSDPLEGWKARQCEAVVRDGTLTLTSRAKPGAAFLGHAMGRASGPVTVRLRVRSATGGPGRVEWLGNPQSGDEPESVPFAIAAGEWSEISVDVPAQGQLGTTRVYLPATAQPLEVDWIELRAAGTEPRPRRWDFNARDGGGS